LAQANGAEVVKGPRNLVAEPEAISAMPPHLVWL